MYAQGKMRKKESAGGCSATPAFLFFSFKELFFTYFESDDAEYYLHRFFM